MVVLRAQFNAQLWRRNGFSFANQMHSYVSQLYRNEMFDRDILMLQVGGFQGGHLCFRWWPPSLNRTPSSSACWTSSR